MLKLFVKALGFVAALLLSGAASAVGMGGINVTTALGEPLRAEIDLAAVGKADKNKMSARLASPEAFKGAGLDYPGTLPKLKFQIETRANGDPYLKVTSAQPLNEPFVNLLVELTWSSGRLLREYTFLLDPPGFKPEQPKAEAVQPLEPSAASPEEPAAAVVKEESVPMRATAPLDEKVLAEAGVAPAKKVAEGGNVVSGEIKVKRGDTLSKIALETKAPEVSLERMLVAMYRANEDAFDGKNMNRLKTGKILRAPVDEYLSQVAQVEAVKEIHAQAADWHAYRMKLAAASGSVAEQAPKQEVSGKISTTVADKTPAAKESAKEVVRLSKGEAPGDKAAAGGNTKALQDKLHAMEEDAVARNKALKDSNERIAMLEKNIKEMQRLIELKGQPVAAVKPVEVKADVHPEPVKVAEAPVVASAAMPSSAVAPAKPAVRPLPKAAVPPPSLLDEILDEPLYLAGGAAALLSLGGIGFMLARRRGQGKGDVGSGAHIAAPVSPSPETGDFTHAATVAPAGAAEEVDPISEADLFLNFGRDVQAEDILKDALKKNPDNQQVRLKLLSIYANRKDVQTFASVAQQVRDSGDAAAWALAAEMGRALEPGNPMYGGDGAAVVAAGTAEETITVKAGQTATSLDFDLGLGEAEVAAGNAAAPDVTTATSSGLDFDLGFGAPEEAVAEEPATPVAAQADTSSALDFDLGLGGQAAVPVEAAPAVQEAAMDFDITAEHLGLAAQAEESAPSLDDLVFDVTATHLSPATMVEEMAAAEASAGAEDAMAFTLDFPVPEESAVKAEPALAVAKEADAIDLSEINLNLDAPAAVPVDEFKDARWHDVATKLDLARAYQEMGDASGAREILEEVLNEGDAQQRAAAEVMLEQLVE